MQPCVFRKRAAAKEPYIFRKRTLYMNPYTFRKIAPEKCCEKQSSQKSSETYIKEPCIVRNRAL